LPLALVFLFGGAVLRQVQHNALSVSLVYGGRVGEGGRKEGREEGREGIGVKKKRRE